MTHKDGGSTAKRFDGTVTMTSRDGRKTTIERPDGTRRTLTVNPDGSVTIGPGTAEATKTTVTEADGSHKTLYSDGSHIKVSKDGAAAIVVDAKGRQSTALTNGDGSLSLSDDSGERKTVNADGRMVSDSRLGTVMTVNKDGSVTIASNQDGKQTVHVSAVARPQRRV